MATKLAGRTRDDYLELVRKFPLTSIKDEAELKRAQAVMDRLLAQGPLRRGQLTYLDALSDLVMAYENTHHAIPAPSDADMLRHLMEAKGVSQKELHEATGIAALDDLRDPIGQATFRQRYDRRAGGLFWRRQGPVCGELLRAAATVAAIPARGLLIGANRSRAICEQRGPSASWRKPMEIKRSGSQPSGKGPADYFTGAVRIDPLFEAAEPARVRGVSVTFEPGARTAWHTHPLGQTLIVTAGCGWAQRWGGPVEEIRPGDVVWFGPGEKHWHGATAATAMTHLAIVEKLDGKTADWMEQVSDEQYRAS